MAQCDAWFDGLELDECLAGAAEVHQDRMLECGLQWAACDESAGDGGGTGPVSYPKHFVDDLLIPAY